MALSPFNGERAIFATSVVAGCRTVRQFHCNRIGALPVPGVGAALGNGDWAAPGVHFTHKVKLETHRSRRGETTRQADPRNAGAAMEQQDNCEAVGKTGTGSSVACVLDCRFAATKSTCVVANRPAHVRTLSKCFCVWRQYSESQV
jgi:hypothetical protein